MVSVDEETEDGRKNGAEQPAGACLGRQPPKSGGRLELEVA